MAGVEPERRRVLVTGGSRGIGRAIALDLARAGFDLALAFHRNKAAAEETAAQVATLGRKVRLLAFDVADREAAREVLEAEVGVHGGFWGVVCNAGIRSDALFPRLSADAWERVLRTNLDGFYNVLQPTVMPMVRARRGGRIVAIASLAGLAGSRGQVNYSASKAGLIGAARSLAHELASRGITVNCVAPGFIETEMLEGMPRDELAARIPMGRLGQPEEVASVVAFLFSEGAAYLTGQVISVNGGML